MLEAKTNTIKIEARAVYDLKNNNNNNKKTHVFISD